MSFFPTMLQPAPVGENRQFLVQINDHGQTVVYSMGADGKATTFAVCDTIEEMLLDLLRSRYPDAVIYLNKPDHNLPYVLSGVYGTFRECADELNRKPRRTAGRLIFEVLYRLSWVGKSNYQNPLNKYVINRGSVYVVTPAGKEHDDRFHPVASTHAASTDSNPPAG